MDRPTDKQFADWHSRLFVTALRMTGDYDAAGDLAQEAMLKACRNWHRFDARNLPTTWLHSILVNCVRDWRRRQAVRSSEPLEEWTLVPAANSTDQPVRRLEEQEQLAHLRAAIENLPVTLQATFVAVVMDGFSYQETAELQSISAGTVASRVHEARVRLRAAMLKTFGEA
jgi:RNA polymerase sigma-70 factor (ECF subfamily)